MSARVPRYVYGPVPSRRLGRSLGIDLVPFKTCSYDCVYCQLGRTTYQTATPEEHAPVAAILEELAGTLRRGPHPDFIGLAGSGEPTLHARIGELIAGIKRLTSLPVAVLTNGSLLWRPEVRAGLARADLVMPSLDAGCPRVFERVNRPHRDIPFERMVDGLVAFAAGFAGQIWLEVFVLRGITDRPAESGRIAAIAKQIRPARVQLNTVSRPPAEADARPASTASLERLRRRFQGRCEVIAGERPATPGGAAAGRDAGGEILALVSRRPCTVDGIATGLGLAPNEVLKHLDGLCATGAVRSSRSRRGSFYHRGGRP